MLSSLAVDGDTAVVRVEVSYGPPINQEYRDLWIIRFAEDGRCEAFEEWPFAPRSPAGDGGWARREIEQRTQLSWADKGPQTPRPGDFGLVIDA